MSPFLPRISVAWAGVVVGLGALVAAAFGWRAWSTEPRAAIEARQALADGRYDDASRVLAGLLVEAPEAPVAHFLKGRVAVAMGRLHEAAGELAQAQTLGLAPGDLALLRALIASKTGRHTEAEPTLSQAFAEALSPDRQIDEALAKTYIETFDLKRAELVLDRWTRDFPADPKPYLWRAEVDGRTAGDPGAVENDYREALRRDASLAKARLGLAEELRRAHRTAEAAQEYEIYLTTHPDDAEAHLGAGRNLMEQGDEKAAAVHLNRAITLDPKNAEPLKELADAASRNNDWAAALVLLDRAIALDSYDVTVRHSRGLTLRAPGPCGRRSRRTGGRRTATNRPRSSECGAVAPQHGTPRPAESARGRNMDVRPRPRARRSPVGREDLIRAARRRRREPPAGRLPRAPWRDRARQLLPPARITHARCAGGGQAW